MAHGWDDKIGGGYLKRTFRQLGSFTYVDKTIVGANSTQLQKTLYKGDYSKWLHWYSPKLVVISWGLLNDCLPKTPKTQFDQYLKQEISEALAAHATVYVVTPPVTIVSYTQYRIRQQNYVNDEQQVFHQFTHQPVYFFNVFDQMKEYLKIHNISVYDFGTNTWHPNSLGHAIAAQILIRDIQQVKSKQI